MFVSSRFTGTTRIVVAVEAGGGCFLCEPDAGLVYMGSESFFAMLGHGPLSEGYSLIATREHDASMLDVSEAEAEELGRFTVAVKQRLRTHYGPTLVTEHGRVAACVAAAVRRYEPHCLHAHRLVFPGEASLDLQAEWHGLSVARYGSSLEAWRGFGWDGEYLYAEDDDGACMVAPSPSSFPRQLFRGVIARRSGQPEAANWADHPRLEVVSAARHRLGVLNDAA